VIHVAYFLCLRRGYERADLSVVYPVARGSGPLFASVAAILFLGEPATASGLIGLAFIVLGTFTIGGGLAMLRGSRSERLSQGLYWGSLTGLLIATYTVNDGYAVRVLGLAPLLFDWLSITVRAALLTPAALMQRASVRQSITSAWRPMLAVGLMSPLAYILVLYAMTLAPISMVAPAREVSMLVAAFFGARLLGEGSARRRVLGAAFIAGGVVALATGQG
jgi:drug/metabolite transporter (DMT)-like permease